MSFGYPSHPLAHRPGQIRWVRTPQPPTPESQGSTGSSTSAGPPGPAWVAPYRPARPDPGLVLAHTLLSYHSSVVKVPFVAYPTRPNDPVRTGSPGKSREFHSPRRVVILPHPPAPVKSDHRCFPQPSRPPTQDFRPVGSGRLPIQRPGAPAPPRRTQDPSLPHPIAPVKSDQFRFPSLSGRP